jgi:hypothetical protein
MKLKRKNEEAIPLNSVTVSDTSQRIDWLLRGIGSLIVGILKLPLRLLYYLFNGRVPKFENIRQEEAFWRVKRRYRRRRILTLHSTIFLVACLLAIISAVVRTNSFYHSSPNLVEDLNYFYRTDLLAGVIVFGVWLFSLSIHAVIVSSAQNEDNELERVMEREYERIESEREPEQYDESNIEPDTMTVKRNSHTNHHLE